MHKTVDMCKMVGTRSNRVPTILYFAHFGLLMRHFDTSLSYWVERICPFVPGASGSPARSHAAGIGMQRAVLIVRMVSACAQVLMEHEHPKNQVKVGTDLRPVARLAGNLHF